MGHLVEFEGQVHEFPDDFTPADIQHALASVPAQAVAPAAPTAPGLGAQNAAQSGRRYVPPEAPKPIERPMSVLPSSVGGAVRDFSVGAQGVGKGLVDIATGIPDLVAGAQNAATSGVNRVFGTNIPYAIPASKLVEKGADAIG